MASGHETDHRCPSGPVRSEGHTPSALALLEPLLRLATLVGVEPDPSQLRVSSLRAANGSSSFLATTGPDVNGPSSPHSRRLSKRLQTLFTTAQSPVSPSFVSSAFTDLTKCRTQLVSSTVRSSTVSRAITFQTPGGAPTYPSPFRVYRPSPTPTSTAEASPRTRTSRGAVPRTLPSFGRLPAPRAPPCECSTKPPDGIRTAVCPLVNCNN